MSVPEELLPPTDYAFANKASDELRIYANVTMDCFHFGHVNFLRQCAMLAKKKHPTKRPSMIVGLCSDESCATGKRPPIFSWQERAAMIYNCKYVEHVIKVEYITPREDIVAWGIDMIVTGTDYKQPGIEKYFPGSEHLHTYVEYTGGISTTDICKRFASVTVKKSAIFGTDPDSVKKAAPSQLASADSTPLKSEMADEPIDEPILDIKLRNSETFSSSWQMWKGERPYSMTTGLALLSVALCLAVVSSRSSPFRLLAFSEWTLSAAMPTLEPQMIVWWASNTFLVLLCTGVWWWISPSAKAELK